MDQNPEKSSDANEKIRLGRDCNVSPASNQPQVCSSVAPPLMFMPSSGFWPTGPNLANPGGLLANTMWTDPYLMSGAGYTAEQMFATNYAFYNACLATTLQSIIEGFNDPMWSMHQLGWGGLQSRIAPQDPRGVTSTFQDSKNLASNQNMDFGRQSDQTSESPLKVIPSKTLVSSDTIATLANQEGPINVMLSNRPNEGSFSKFFTGRSLEETTGKCVTNENLKASDKSLSTPTVRHKSHNTPTAQNESNSSGEVHETLMNVNSLSSQPYPQDIVRKGPGLPYCGINLREWLESNRFNASKNARLRLFRKIVQIVDIQHGQGIALMELRPSSFIMFNNGDVKYTGSLMDTELWSLNQDNTKKRGLELDFPVHEKMQKVGNNKLVRPETSFISRLNEEKTTNEYSLDNVDMSSICNAQGLSTYEETSTRNSWLTSENAMLEKMWYVFPEKFKIRDLLSFNIYSLGLLLFELLCNFDSIEVHAKAISDLHHRILPPRFISESPKEAGLCFWLLQPEPSSCPTTSEILQSELISGSDSTNVSDDGASYSEIMNDINETEILHHFLVSMKERFENKASNLVQSLELLDVDLKVIHESSKQTCRKSIGGTKGSCSTSKMNVHRDKLLGKIEELEDIYSSLKSKSQSTEMPSMDRPDKDVLTRREKVPWVQDPTNLPTTKGNNADRVGIFFDGICKFARYNKFEVCGTLKNCDILNSNTVISSLGFDREGQRVAAAGVSKKIKIFEFDSLLDDSVDVHYPIVEMLGNSKFSCICWNNYIRNYLVSAAYDGSVQVWNAEGGQEVVRYNEHQNTTWSVDFSRTEPTRFASGGDDCSLRIWSVNESKSLCTIGNLTNICCVQYSPYSSHLLAFGSPDNRISCYDLRHTKIPWCTLTGHNGTVSYVRFLDSETIVSASIDSTLKLWDLKKTSLLGLSPNACTLTCRDHVNNKHFVGLTVSDGYIACGSETNEVYVYYKSLPMPIATHKFGHIDPLSGEEISNDDSDGYFISNVCWRNNSQMLVAANSKGTIRVLRMV